MVYNLDTQPTTDETASIHMVHTDTNKQSTANTQTNKSSDISFDLTNSDLNTHQREIMTKIVTQT